MKVSICIPTYQQANLLRRCLDSILEQNFEDYEIVITDDSKSLDVSDLVEEYKDSRIRYFRNEPSLGSPLNWNMGFRLAQGEYLKIMHHDDWFASPESLGKFVELLDRNQDADIAFAGSCDIRSENRRKPHVAKSVTLEKIVKEPRILLMENRLGAPSVMIFRNKRNLFFDEKLKWLVDVDLYYRFIQGNTTFAYLSEILVYIGVGEHQTTAHFKQNFNLAIEEMFYVSQKYNLETEYKEVYRRKMIKTLGKEGIYTNTKFRLNFENEVFTFSLLERIIAFMYYVK